MLGASKHKTPPLTDEGEPEKFSWCLEVNAAAVRFLILKTGLEKFSLWLQMQLPYN